MSNLFFPAALEPLVRIAAASLSVALRSESFAIERRLRGMLYQAYFKSKNLRVDRNVTIEGAKRVTIGNDVTLLGSLYLSATSPEGSISIGDGTQIDRNAVIYGQGGLKIGRGCAIAAGVIIYTQTNRYDLGLSLPILQQGTRYRRVSIGDDVWVGAGAIILPGVSIGDHAVIGAGAVVSHDVNPTEIVVGVPARAIKSRKNAS